MEGRKLSFEEIKTSTKEIDEQVETIEGALSRLGMLVDSFPEAWDSENARSVSADITEMGDELKRIKEATGALSKRIDDHVQSVYNADTVGNGE